MSPGLPKAKVVSAAPVVLEFRRYQTPFRTTPGVTVPLPSQSPVTGMSPGLPNAKVVSAPPVVLELRRYQIPSRKTKGFSSIAVTPTLSLGSLHAVDTAPLLASPL